MSVSLPDIGPNDGALVLVWILIVAVFYLILYRAFWDEQRGPHEVESAAPTVASAPRRPARKKNLPTAFLVLDVEGTCLPGTSFDWPNEIIEWPVVLLRWQEVTRITPKGPETARELVAVDEFRSYVQPTWKRQLHPFCTELTGITQAQIDAAPTFPAVIHAFEGWLMKHKLITRKAKQLQPDVVFATDGPWDLRDFATKSFHLSRCSRPPWFPQRFLDVRSLVTTWYVEHHSAKFSGKQPPTQRPAFTIQPSFKLNRQLELLGIGPFQGREHCGIDDSRNIGRVLVELGRRGMDLEPNSKLIPPKWPWMGPNGTVIGYEQ